MSGNAAGARWTTTRRQGQTHREAGRKGGCSSGYGAPRSPYEREEAAMRWYLGDGTQAELAAEYGVSRSTIRRWCAGLKEAGGETASPGEEVSR